MHSLRSAAVQYTNYGTGGAFEVPMQSGTSTILVFVCKNHVALAEFQHIDGSARWPTSFNYNHIPHAGTLPSTGHC